MLKWGARLAGLALAATPFAAWAAGQPIDWGVGLQEAASPVMAEINWFHNLMLYIITAITIFVFVLLAIVIVRFNRKANPTPSKTTHHVGLEIAWTVIPVVILVIVAIPSFQLLYYSDRVENPDITIKAVGRQWYWYYEVPEQEYKGQTIGGFGFSSYMIPDEDIQEGQVRLLSVDNPLALPVGAKVQVLVTASDVLHNFAMPSLGMKLDAVPGRLNETWTLIKEDFAGSTFYGQCSELCGAGHAYMPIEIRAMNDADFIAWAAKAKEEGDPLETASAPAPAPAADSVRIAQVQN